MSDDEKNLYFIIKPVMISVTHEEFLAWISSYPRQLRMDIDATCHPPNITYNDF